MSCACTTLKGARCKNPPSKLSTFCYLHQQCKKVAKMTPKELPKKKVSEKIPKIDNRPGIRRSPLRNIGGDDDGVSIRKPKAKAKLPTELQNFQQLPIPVLAKMLMGMDRAVVNMLCNSDKYIKRNICDNTTWREKYNELHPEGLFHTDTKFRATREVQAIRGARLAPVILEETSLSYLNNFTITITVGRDEVGDVHDIHYFHNAVRLGREPVQLASSYLFFHRTGINYRVFLLTTADKNRFLSSTGMKHWVKEFRKLGKNKIPISHNSDASWLRMKSTFKLCYEASPVLAKKLYAIIKKKLKTLKSSRMTFI